VVARTEFIQNRKRDFMRIRQHIGNVDIDISDARLQKNLKEAQRLLTNQVWADCDPLVPFQQGGLRNSVTMSIHADYIEWNAPYAHYLYEGEVYGPNIPIRDAEGNITGWYSPPSKHPAGRPLTYHTAGTGDHWFEKAKQQHKDEWVRLVKQTAGRD
jgi:hypothetical protein